MADKITYNDKVSLVTDPTIAEINKVTDDNMNEIKSSVNANADQLDETIVIGDSNITNNTKAVINEVDYISYINSEIAIGATNPNNTPTWFKMGKNLFSSKLELGTFTNEGVKSNSTTNYRNATPIQVQPNTTYTISINGVSQKYAVYYYDSSLSFINSEGLTTGTFTTLENCYYINFRCFNADFTSDYANLKLQIEEGSTATTYEAYINPSIIIDEREIYQKQEMTYGQGTINSNYIGSAERNYYYKNGNLVCFACSCTANATWTGQAEIISGLPKPIKNFNFIGFNSNQALPVRFELTTNGVLRKYYSMNGVVNGDVVDLYITYFTID